MARKGGRSQGEGKELIRWVQQGRRAFRMGSSNGLTEKRSFDCQKKFKKEKVHQEKTSASDKSARKRKKIWWLGGVPNAPTQKQRRPDVEKPGTKKRTFFYGDLEKRSDLLPVLRGKQKRRRKKSREGEGAKKRSGGDLISQNGRPGRKNRCLAPPSSHQALKGRICVTVKKKKNKDEKETYNRRA